MMTLKLTDSAKPADQWASGVCLSLLPYATQGWAHSCAQTRPCPTFRLGLGSKVKSLSLHGKYLIHWNFTALFTDFTVITSFSCLEMAGESQEARGISLTPNFCWRHQNDSWKAAPCRDRGPLTNNKKSACQHWCAILMPDLDPRAGGPWDVYSSAWFCKISPPGGRVWSAPWWHLPWCLFTLDHTHFCGFLLKIYKANGNN